MVEPENKMLLRSIRVDKRHIGYIKWLLESHSGMATPTTRDGTVDIIDLLVSKDFEEEFDELLEALGDEMTFDVVDIPDTPPLGG